MENVVLVFSSFEEADAASREERARLIPEQRAEIFFQLRERSQPDALTQGFTRVVQLGVEPNRIDLMTSITVCRIVPAIIVLTIETGEPRVRSNLRACPAKSPT